MSKACAVVTAAVPGQIVLDFSFELQTAGRDLYFYKNKFNNEKEFKFNQNHNTEAASIIKEALTEDLGFYKIKMEPYTMTLEHTQARSQVLIISQLTDVLDNYDIELIYDYKVEDEI